MPSSGRVTVGTFTREAEHHSETSLLLRRVLCFFFGHTPAASFRGSRFEMDGCLTCCRIIEVRPCHDETSDGAE